MKRIFLMTLIIAMSVSLGKAQTGQSIKKVAILEVVDRDNSVNYGVKLLLRTSLAKAITQTSGYEGYDRVDMGAIQGEQDFQRTGMVSDEQIKRLGEMTGAAYVLVAEAAKLDANNVIVTAKVLDVETAKLERTDYEQMGIAAKEIADGCRTMSSRLFVGQDVVVSRKEKTDGITGGKISEEIRRALRGQASTVEESKIVDEEVTLDSDSQVIRKGARLFMENKYGTKQQMSQYQMNNYLENYSKSWAEAKKQRKVGIGLLVTGSVLAGTIGLPIAVSGFSSYGLVEQEFYDYYNDEYYTTSYYDNIVDYGMVIAGFSIFAVGLGLTIAGVPTYVIAEKKMDNILQQIEEQRGIAPYCTSVSLNIGSQPHGFGIGLRF